METVAIVGMSLAGVRAAETLRHEGFSGRIVAVSSEPHLPYDRPPCSKQLLTGEWEPEQAILRRQGYDDLELDWRLEHDAVALHLADRQVELHDGERVHFDGLVIATGARPRRLPWPSDLAGVFTLRTLDDALAIRELLGARPRVAVVGAGFIGSEVAASCRRRGCDVTVIEMLPQPLARAFGPVVGEALARLHRDHGVDLRLGVGVEAVEGSGQVERVRLTDGSTVDADLVVVGVGVEPVTGWLEGSGLTLDDGVVCDETLLAAPGVVAAGDVARWPHPDYGGGPTRIEHWTNANEQGVAAARRLLVGDGPGARYASVPFVWSDQYDVKIQVAGVVAPDDDVRVVGGSVDDHRFVALCGRAGRLTGVVGFGRPRQVMQYRRLLVDGATLDEAVAAGAG